MAIYMKLVPNFCIASDNPVRNCWDTFHATALPAPLTQCWEVKLCCKDCAHNSPQHCLEGGDEIFSYPWTLTQGIILPHMPQCMCIYYKIREVSQGISHRIVVLSSINVKVWLLCTNSARQIFPWCIFKGGQPCMWSSTPKDWFS